MLEFCCREVVRKDRELVEWQLKEKETKAQLHGLEEKVKRSQASPKPPEPRKLLMELPALRESLRSLKAVYASLDMSLVSAVPCFVTLNDTQNYFSLL
jgi:hypothetical protein